MWGFAPRWYIVAPPALLSCVGLFAVFSLLGCNTSHTATTITKNITAQTAQYPTRPAPPPPSFRVFHQDAHGITLVTAETTSDIDIESLIWQLRDAAHAHTLDALHISQKLVDARDPYAWFHIYRGPRCAAEKYAPGAPPCGPSYHAAGDYTLGGFTQHDHDEGILLKDENHQTELWNPDAPTGTHP